MNKKYTDEAAGIFAKNKEAQVVYFTADGRPFLIKNHAENYAATLSDTAIYTHRREEVAEGEEIKLQDEYVAKEQAKAAAEATKVQKNK